MEYNLQLWHLFATVLAILLPLGGFCLRQAYNLGNLNNRVDELEKRREENRDSLGKVFEALDELRRDHANIAGKLDTLIFIHQNKDSKND